MSAKALVFALALMVAPASARAVTLYDIVALSNAGVPDTILTALVDVDGASFDLTAQQILELRDAGVSDAVIVRMIGRSQPAIAAAQVAESTVVTVAVPYFVPVPVETHGPRRRVDRATKDRKDGKEREDEGLHRGGQIGDRIGGGIAAGLRIRNGEFVR